MPSCYTVKAALKIYTNKFKKSTGKVTLIQGWVNAGALN